MKRMLVILSLFSGIIWSDTVWADRAYVTDSFEITYRTGPGTNHKIIRMISSGQSVEVVREEGEWSLVKLPGGDEEGWVVSRYLISRLPWEVQAKALQEEAATLRAKLRQTDKDFGAASGQAQDLAAELKRKTQELDRLRKEHAELRSGAEGYLKLKTLHEAAEQNLSAARNELRRVVLENEEMRSSQLTRWFLNGALVLLCGLLTGALVGRQQKMRRSFYD
jgi:SH3 domain protein